ncbi:MAG: ATP-binding protein [Desulfosudaceae bacterium]
MDRNDEIGRLYRSFEEMLARLKERQSNLEEKVILREAALKETDSKLRKTRLIAERSEKFAAIGRMGAAVAHEIRTPLTSLKLFLESVDELLQQSSSDQEDFGIAMGQIQRMEKTINRFLDFARPRQLVFAEIDVSDLIEDVLLMVKPLANRQECVIEVQAAENLPPVFGDRQLLAEALINVLVNALEALPDHGTVVIAAVAGSFDNAGEKTPCVRVDIRDYGHGISEESISAIFEPFFTTKAAGTGLGLPLVLNTIQSHGGTVEVVSQKKEGTTFSLFLPLEISKISGRDDGTDTDHR